MHWYGGIEAGGTKFNCIVAADPDHILAESRISTSTPDETLPKVLSFFSQIEKKNDIHLLSLGLGSFGPIDLNPQSPAFGSITSTPKLAWRNTNILDFFKQSMQIPVGFDLDVMAAALGEGKWGAARDYSDFVYVTIGTGIGGGVVVNGHPLHGLIHPEIGHLFLPHDKNFDPFSGNCPSHGDCLEGLASGTAIKARLGISAESLPPDHPYLIIEAGYLGYMLANIVLSYSPQKIILGGGVMKIPGLIEAARSKMVSLLNGYVQNELVIRHPESYIQLPGLGDKSGVLGAIVLAQNIL